MSNILMRQVVTLIVIFAIQITSKTLCLLNQTEVGKVFLRLGLIFYRLVLYYLCQDSDDPWVRKKALHQVSLIMRFKIR